MLNSKGKGGNEGKGYVMKGSVKGGVLLDKVDQIWMAQKQMISAYACHFYDCFVVTMGFYEALIFLNSKEKKQKQNYSL